MRKLINIRIDPKTYQTAREMGLNISKTCENSLKQTIQRLTASNPNSNCGGRSDSWCGGLGSNLGLNPCFLHKPKNPIQDQFKSVGVRFTYTFIIHVFPGSRGKAKFNGFWKGLNQPLRKTYTFLFVYQDQKNWDVDPSDGLNERDGRWSIHQEILHKHVV